MQYQEITRLPNIRDSKFHYQIAKRKELPQEGKFINWIKQKYNNVQYYLLKKDIPRSVQSTIFNTSQLDKPEKCMIIVVYVLSYKLVIHVYVYTNIRKYSWPVNDLIFEFHCTKSKFSKFDQSYREMCQYFQHQIYVQYGFFV